MVQGANDCGCWSHCCCRCCLQQQTSGLQDTGQGRQAEACQRIRQSNQKPQGTSEGTQLLLLCPVRVGCYQGRVLTGTQLAWSQSAKAALPWNVTSGNLTRTAICSNSNTFALYGTALMPMTS
jgi:hypothetical protein